MAKVQICQKTQLFLDPKKYRYAGDIATFERQIYLPKNGRNRKDGSLVISLQYQYLWNLRFFAELF